MRKPLPNEYPHYYSRYINRVGDGDITLILDEQKEEMRILRKLIDKLPLRLRGTVLLTEFSNMSYDEIGRSLGIPAGTVGSRRNKAIKIMKEKFQKIYGE